MHIPTNKLYANPEQAEAEAGLPREQLLPVHVIESGPHKGNIYQLLPDGSLGKRIQFVETASVQQRVRR
jgi:hypothetical protein